MTGLAWESLINLGSRHFEAKILVLPKWRKTLVIHLPIIHSVSQTFHAYINYSEMSPVEHFVGVPLFLICLAL